VVTEAKATQYVSRDITILTEGDKPTSDA